MHCEWDCVEKEQKGPGWTAVPPQVVTTHFPMLDIDSLIALFVGGFLALPFLRLTWESNDLD